MSNGLNKDSEERFLSDTEAYLDFVCTCVTDAMHSLPPDYPNPYRDFYLEWLDRAEQRLRA